MKKYTTEELCLLWLDSFIGLEYKHKAQLFSLLQGKPKIGEVLEKGKNYIVSNIGEKDYELIKNSANDVYLKYVLDGLKRRKITAITVNSVEYPKLLKQTSIPPLVLYYKGDVKLLNENLFGIVGSRRCLPIAKKTAEQYTKTLIKAGFVPVTGTAEGIDEVVLRTSISNGGKVVSVLAGGFDHVYPASNIELLDKVAEKGLVITEHAPETVTKPYFFPVRNRIIAGLSKGVLIASASIKSGAIYTAEYAEEYGRDLFAVPYGVGVPTGAGCNDLIKRGARLTDVPEDILEFYGIESKSEQVELSSLEREIVQALSNGNLHVEKLCEIINKPVYVLSPTLSAMEIKGIVIKTGVNVYGLTRGR